MHYHIFRLAFAPLAVAALMTVATGRPAIWAQSNAVGELSADEQQALETITERSVTGTVAFLASDEMAGRGTPSPEFDMAAAYVAARFQAAGLTGGGDEGSYYQIAEVDTTQVPDSGIVFTLNSPRQHYGLLSAGTEPVQFSGELATVDPDADTPLTGAVILTFDAGYTDRRGMMALSRAVSQVQSRGAVAVVMPVPADSALIGMARANAGRAQISSRGRLSLPVLLCRAEDSLEGPCELLLPAALSTKARMRNVIGILEGSDPQLAEEAIVFSAHLDHLGVRPGESDPIYNGADDDASGVTAVLALADAFGGLAERPRRTTIFMTFWGEERGLLGSRHYAENPLWPHERIVANINIEMIGRPESGARNKVWMTGWDHSNLGDLMALGARRVETLVFAHPKYSGDMLYGASDNRSLVEKGVIAHSFSAGSLHEDYHQPTDDWQKLELDHMTAVIRGLFAGALPLADGDLTPAKSDSESAR